MRLMLNKMAADNITDLFPTDWQPRPTVSSVQEKTLQSADRSNDRHVLTMWSLN